MSDPNGFGTLGGLCGAAGPGSVLKLCSSSGEICGIENAVASFAGGLLGAALGDNGKNAASVQRCCAQGTVTGGTWSGGLIGNASKDVYKRQLYNFQLMSIAGENGVAAYGVIMYVNIIFMAIFLGYSIGSAPIVSYHYGAENHTELKSMFRKSLILLTVSGVSLVVLSELVARPLVMIFTSYDPELLDICLLYTSRCV